MHKSETESEAEGKKYDCIFFICWFDRACAQGVDITYYGGEQCLMEREEGNICLPFYTKNNKGILYYPCLGNIIRISYYFLGMLCLCYPC